VTTATSGNGDRSFSEDVKVSKLTLDKHLEEQGALVLEYGKGPGDP
jgi:hypothetical protein